MSNSSTIIDIRRQLQQRMVRMNAERTAQKSAVHKIALFCVFLTVATSSLVFVEPALSDALTLGLMVLLPAIGLMYFAPGLMGFSCLMLVLSATGVFSASFATDMFGSTKHMAITVYLSAAAVLFATFVAYKPREHTQLILNAYLVASLIAAIAGIVGVLNIIPGTNEIFTLYDRAKGTFKDPNVLGAFLVPALTYTIHLVLNKRAQIAFPAFLATAILSAAIILTYSRGAWLAAFISVAAYLYLFFVFSPRDTDRVRIAIFSLLGVAGVFGLIALVLQFDATRELLSERAVFTQSYDQGVEGRFGGQRKAVDIILENPLGIGALEFTAAGHHHENAHNTFLTFFMSNGWLGGMIFAVLTILTITLGFLHLLKRFKTHALFIVVYASLLAIFVQALFIDIDHWRHAFLLLGLAWGIMGSETRAITDRSRRIVRDRRHKLLKPTVTVLPMRRGNRIIRKLPERIELPRKLDAEAKKRFPCRRPSKIIRDLRLQTHH